MLRLRRGTVVSADPLIVRIGEEERRAWADLGLVGEVAEGDEVIVNVESVELGLGSGGFDVVHANLTRGLEAGRSGGEHVIKLNYTSIQHPVDPVEAGAGHGDWMPARRIPVLVCFLHGQLAPVVWAAAGASEEPKIGYVQTAGGALPGSLSRDVTELRERGLICGHITAAPCYGGELESVSVTGALHAAAEELGWDGVIAAPGPGILGSDSRYGHGGMAALDSAHAALALGLPTGVAPRLSAADPRPRHRGVSHHTEAVLRLLLGSVNVAAPPTPAAEKLEPICEDRHRLSTQPADLDGYSASGLPVTTMGRGIDEDPDFFAAALAGGSLIAEMIRESTGTSG